MQLREIQQQPCKKWTVEKEGKFDMGVIERMIMKKMA